MSPQNLPGARNPRQWAEDVMYFWFQELTPQDWFKKNPQVDETIRQRFSTLYETLRKNPATPASLDPQTLLATVIVLDQFPRNLFRGSAETYATDVKALDLAKYAVANGMDRSLTPQQRHFLYIPFMHSEDRAMQAESLRLYTEADNEDGVEWAQHHKSIVDRFGRFPHRNAILGRESTLEELEFLKHEQELSS